jgi:hypothetical protein
LRGAARRVKLPMMFLRSAIKIAEWTGAILAGFALVIGGCMWLLSRGPLSLDWLAPYVATTFSQSKNGVSAQIDHTLISLGEGPSLQIIARGLHLKRTDGRAELALPEVALSLSPQAALLGEVAPTRIELHGARLHLLRSADGSFHFGLAGERLGNNDWAESLLQELSHPPDRNGAFGYLSEVRITNATLTVDDRKLDVTWEAQRLDATLRRGTEGFTGKLALAIERDGHSTQLQGDLEYQATPHRIRMALSFDNLRPALYAAAAPALAPFAAFDLPLGGQISMALDAETRRVTDFWCDLQLGQGRIVNDRFVGGALKIVEGTLRAVYDPTTQRLDLEHFSAKLNAPNGPMLDFAGAILQFDPLATTPLAFTGHGQIRGVSFDDLGQLWPEQSAVHARDWMMTHVLQGTVTHAEVTLGGTVLLGSSAGLVAKLDKVEGDFAYRDVAVQYLRPLSPVRNIDGTAHFNRAQFTLLPDGGTARDVKVTGKVVLTKLDTDNEEATIDVAIVGPLATVLDELNTKPLRYARALGVDPAGVKGTAKGDLHFHFPMKKGLRFAMVDYAAHGTLDGVAIDKILFDRDLTAGALRVTVDRGGVDLDGDAKLDGVPIALDWKENFTGDPIRTRYRLHGVFDDAARRKLGVDWLPEMLAGPVGLDLTFARHRNNFAESDVTLDLAAATLTIDKLGWTKKAGVPASAHFDIAARDELSARISNISIHGGGLDARLDISLTGGEADAKIGHVNIYRLTVGRTDVAGVVARRPEGGWSVQLHGRSFDASRWLDDMQKATPGNEPEPPLEIEAALDRVLLTSDRVIDNIRAKLFSDGVHWQTARIDAAPSPGKKITLRFGGAEGDRNFKLSSDDLGAVLRLLDISGKVEGGEVTVTARAEDNAKGRALSGKINGTNYRVVGAPAFARLISLASFTGAAALANGQGIPFSRMQSDFVLENGIIELRNARAYGEAIGINASGYFDYRSNKLDMSGTIVPAYLVNSLLSNIPVLGDLLMGGRGEGIFAANFRVSGSAADPGISVNPLSALAPGFLRGLFLFDAGTPGQDNARRTIVPNGG